jgi:hypothetical protein
LLEAEGMLQGVLRHEQGIEYGEQGKEYGDAYALAWLELGCPYRALQDAVECVQMNPSWTKVQPGTGNP